MLVSIATTQTPQAARYLTQLCKHFQHRLPVTLEERHGHIAFDAGTCDLDAVATRSRCASPPKTNPLYSAWRMS